MADTLDVDAMIKRFRDRAAAVKQRPLPPVAGAERQHFLQQAQTDFQDFAIIGDAERHPRGRHPRPAGRPAAAGPAPAAEGGWPVGQARCYTYGRTTRTWLSW